MRLTALENSLVEAMASFEIIDCHEHLEPESERLKAEVDVFTLFSHYTRGDLMVAGMTEPQYQSLFNTELPLDWRWTVFAPFWKQIRWGSYARAALLAAKKFYGFDDIDEDTYVPLSEAIQKANTPGIYERVLKDACNIRTALAQCNRTDLGSPLLTPVMPLMPNEMASWYTIVEAAGKPVEVLGTLDDLLEALHERAIQLKSEGTVGFKLMAHPFGVPDRDEANEVFDGLHDGRIQWLPASNPLRDFLVDQLVAYAAALDMPVAVHTGYWGDFRQLDPLHLIPMLQRNPNVRFDLYHLGFPWVREAIMLGKGFPNVWLNLCWTHIISQRFVMAALDEMIDLIPMNKILAFGGDYGLPVEKVYGHLVMAREDIARVLARRIEDNEMTESQALALAKQWFWDNPVELYRLSV
ncbi:MAG: Amidohydrolase family protein [Candidatus Hydrogenedentes bacterium]|nr:Amidohydrolase family protein [Candidatus Hydrogenedentota bacterium]